MAGITELKNKKNNEMLVLPTEINRSGISNAVFHRSYEIREPIEVRILPDKITINSFPGPDRSITDNDLKTLQCISRRYRNRRIGEFLKELHLTEIRGTGFPKIVKKMKDNGSPIPIIHTDTDRSFFQIEFSMPIEYLKLIEEDKRLSDQVSTQVTTQVSTQVLKLLNILSDNTLSIADMLQMSNLKQPKSFRKLYLIPAIEQGFIEMLYPDKPNSSKQKYRITVTDKAILESIESESN